MTDRCEMDGWVGGWINRLRNRLMDGIMVFF